MKLFIVSGLALTSAETTNECDKCWEMGKGKNGHWTLDLSNFGWVIDLSINIMSVS